MEICTKLLLFTMFFVKNVLSYDVSVFVFGKTLPKVPALSSISSSHFLSLIQPEINDNKIIIVFVSPSLRIEDVSHCKEHCLKKFSDDFSYLPHVEFPTKVFQNASKSSLSTIFEQIQSGEKFLIINLEKEETGKVLPYVYNSLIERHPDVILIFTGYPLKKAIKKRSIENTPLESRHILLAAEAISERTGKGSEMVSDIQSIATSVNGSSIYATLFPLNFTLKFILQGNVWSLRSAFKDDQVFKIPKYVSALDSYSYRCEQNLTFYHKYNVIKIINSQILVSFSEDHPKFNLKKVFYCDSYVTPGILAGLSVAAILLGVLICGLMWIADIKTMDRFDNHRSKGLIIVADD